MKRDPLWRGLEPHGAGWRAVVSQGRDRPRFKKHFPAGTPPQIMQAWRRDTRDKLRYTRKIRSRAGLFRADVRRYLALEAVKRMPTVKERTYHLRLWTAVFSDLPTDAITANQIESQKIRWATEPRSAKDDRPLSAVAVNHRLKALSNLFARLYPDWPNPVRKVPEETEARPAGKGRAIPYSVIQRILAALPDRGRADRGAHVPTFSRTKIRLRCLAYCQITAGQMMRLTPEDLDLSAGAIRLPRRYKGRGADARWVPLVTLAVAAFTDFMTHNLFGRFSTSSTWKSFNRAAAQVGLGPLRVYDLRHSFASALVAASKDDGAAQMALQHGSPETTRRYTESAVDPRIRDAMTKLNAVLGEHSGGT